MAVRPLALPLRRHRHRTVRAVVNVLQQGVALLWVFVFYYKLVLSQGPTLISRRHRSCGAPVARPRTRQRRGRALTIGLQSAFHTLFAFMILKHGGY